MSEFDRFLKRDGHDVDISTLEPFKYIADLPGKDIRGKLVDCFNVWLRISEERVQDVKE